MAKDNLKVWREKLSTNTCGFAYYKNESPNDQVSFFMPVH